MSGFLSGEFYILKLKIREHYVTLYYIRFRVKTVMLALAYIRAKEYVIREHIK